MPLESAEQMGGAEREALARLHRMGLETVALGDIAGYYRLSDQFHDMIYAGSHNGILAEMAAPVRQRVAPFRRAQFSSMGRLTLSHAEHDRVVQAILARNGMAAAEAMLAHIRVVRLAFDEVASGAALAADQAA